jgi:DNA-binding LacI/PurR family transcriptional regulator
VLENGGRTAGRRPTLEDVATQAGVSRALVSIVMRGAPGASADTRERVLQVAADIGYRPDARARMLARGSSRLIGVVFGAAGSFHLELLDGVYSAADGSGYDVILSALTPSRDERRAVETLLDFRCEGVILFGPETDAPVLAGRLPVVVVGWEVDDPAVDVVRSSDDEGMHAAVDHLVALGHRAIAHVDGGAGPVSAARRRAYHAAMRHHGLESHVRVLDGGFRQEHGIAAARAIVDEGPSATAVVAFNDDVAVGLAESFHRAGVAVPRDVSIVGWDDSSLARLPYLDLTSVRQDVAEMTRLAVERSAARIAGQEIAEREIVLSPELIVRSSTGPAPLR